MGLLVIAVIGTIAVPRLGQALRVKVLRDAVDDMVDAVEFARLSAAATGKVHGLMFTPPAGNGTPLKAQVVQGIDLSCASLFDPAAKIVRPDRPGDNRLDFTDAAITNRDMVKLVQVSPSEATGAKAFPCFKPDGRVLRADMNRPYVAADVSLAAGELVLALRRFNTTDEAIGETFQVVIPYSGLGRFDVGAPMP